MMAGWLMNNQKLSPIGLIKDEMTMNYMFGQKSSLDLMQNCDLPPPLKVFSGPDKTVLSPTNNVWRVEEEEDHKEANIEPKQELGSDRFELLKALRRSQTRAREAERKYQELHKEKNALSNFLIEESARSLAYKNWIKVLEFQILQLKTQQQQQQQQQQQHVDRIHRIKEDEDKNWIKVVELQILQLKTQQQQHQQHVNRLHRTKEDEDKNAANGVTWFVAVALCLGIAAIGCRYLL